MTDTERIPVWAERLLLVVAAPLVFVGLCEIAIAGELMPDLVAHYRWLHRRQAMEHQRSLCVTSDGCHPDRIGNSLIAEQLEAKVRDALGQPALPSPSGESP